MLFSAFNIKYGYILFSLFPHNTPPTFRALTLVRKGKLIHGAFINYAFTDFPALLNSRAKTFPLCSGS
jgi:hypothetical protein